MGQYFSYTNEFTLLNINIFLRLCYVFVYEVCVNLHCFFSDFRGHFLLRAQYRFGSLYAAGTETPADEVDARNRCAAVFDWTLPAWIIQHARY